MNRFIIILRYVLIGFFASWILIWSSIRAFKISQNKAKNLNGINKFLIGLHDTPYQIKHYFQKSELGADLEGDDSILKIHELKGSDRFSDSLYMLHSKIIDNKNLKVFLENINTGEIAYTWDIPSDPIMQDLDSLSRDLKTKSRDNEGPKNLNAFVVKSPRNLIIRHPLVLKDSSLIFKVQYLSHMYKFDKNSNLLWKSKKLAHHSIELDGNGNIWTCSIDLKNKVANRYQYREDAILCLDQNGRELFFESLTNIFQENNLFKKYIEATPSVSNTAGIDPYHLNDVQPVLQNGSYWKKGDLFLSLRHKSLVLLYRPSTNDIVWIQQGPWLEQHDINIENDSVISIFNNNTSFLNGNVISSSNISFYNFRGNYTYDRAHNLFSTPSEGRQTSLSNGDFVVESTNEAKYLLLDRDFNLKEKFYVPYQLDTNLAQYPGWSRFYLMVNGKLHEE